MSFSFLIHASDDKRRLAPIVRRLLDAGIGLWIDDPNHEDLNLSRDDIDRLGGFIIPGKDWPRQRDDALQRASSVLIGITDASLQSTRSQVRAEVAIAEFREAHQGTPVLPVALSAGELERAATLIGRRQSFKTFVEANDGAYELTVRGERAVEEVIAALRIAQRARPGLPADAPPVLDAASPYFADRSIQSQEVTRILRAQRDDGGTIFLPVIVGGYEDRPDKFALDQLPARLLPRVLRVAGCHAVSINWPYCALGAPSRALEMLSSELAEISSIKQAMVIYTQPPPLDITQMANLAHCLALWGRFWAQARPRIERSPILPVIDIRIEPAGRRRRGIMDFFSARRGLTREEVGQAVDQLQDQVHGARLVFVPPLQPVTWQCVEAWLREEVEVLLGEHHTARYRRDLREHFLESGMEMEAWAHRAHHLFHRLHRST